MCLPADQQRLTTHIEKPDNVHHDHHNLSIAKHRRKDSQFPISIFNIPPSSSSASGMKGGGLGETPEGYGGEVLVRVEGFLMNG